MNPNQASVLQDQLAGAIGTIDHVVIAVDGLAQAAETYRQLGFTLSTRGVHSAALGTSNHTIMLARDYFELLAVESPTERNSEWRRVIGSGGGLAGMAMSTQDPHAARAHWLAAGLSPETPIKFARSVPRPDGSVLEARFEVVSLDEMPDTGLRLFVCSQPTREAVWLPELVSHANTAVAIRRLVLGCPDPERSAAQWQRALPAARRVPGGVGVTLDTGRHQLVLTVQHSGKVRAVGIDYAVADLSICRAVLERAQVPLEGTDTRLVVPAKFACNVTLGFEAAIH